MMLTRQMAWAAMQMCWVCTRTCPASRRMHQYLQMHEKSSEYPESSQNCLTYLVGLQNGSQMSQTAAGTQWICRADAWMCHALETTQNWLKTRQRTSKRVKSIKRPKTHLKRPKTGCPSLPIAGERLASIILMHTYHGACLLRHWAERLHLERPRVEARQLRPVLMVETSRRGLAAETETTEMWTTWKAAATLTHNESKVRGCL